MWRTRERAQERSPARPPARRGSERTVVEIDRALEQIDEIYGHLERTEVYRGYRPVPVAISGVIAVVAGVLQPHVVGTGASLAYVGYWSTVAAVCAALIIGEIVFECVTSRSAVFRRTTLRVLCQFLPSLAAGAVVTLALARHDDGLVALLPGLWALIFGIGILASRPFLPRAIGWVGLLYFVGGCALLALPESSTSPWSMATVFGAGQFLAALVLHRNLERRDDGATEEVGREHR